MMDLTSIDHSEGSFCRRVQWSFGAAEPLAGESGGALACSFQRSSGVL
jgi:hypothetical protein